MFCLQHFENDRTFSTLRRCRLDRYFLKRPRQRARIIAIFKLAYSIRSIYDHIHLYHTFLLLRIIQCRFRRILGSNLPKVTFCNRIVVVFRRTHLLVYICRILSDTHKEVQDLARYKSMLQKEVREAAKNPDMTMEDVDDLVEAANKMLEEKGIAPMKLGPISRRLIQRRKGF